MSRLAFRPSIDQATKAARGISAPAKSEKEEFVAGTEQLSGRVTDVGQRRAFSIVVYQPAVAGQNVLGKANTEDTTADLCPQRCSDALVVELDLMITSAILISDRLEYAAYVRVTLVRVPRTVEAKRETSRPHGGRNLIWHKSLPRVFH